MFPNLLVQPEKCLERCQDCRRQAQQTDGYLQVPVWRLVDGCKYCASHYGTQGDRRNTQKHAVPPGVRAGFCMCLVRKPYATVPGQDEDPQVLISYLVEGMRSHESMVQARLLRFLLSWGGVNQPMTELAAVDCKRGRGDWLAPVRARQVSSPRLWSLTAGILRAARVSISRPRVKATEAARRTV